MVGLLDDPEAYGQMSDRARLQATRIRLRKRAESIMSFVEEHTPPGLGRTRGEMKPGPVDITAVQKVLILKMRYIGDTVLTTPLIRALRDGFPSARIDIGVNQGSDQILVGHPFIGKLWRFDPNSSSGRFRSGADLVQSIRREKYDLVADLTCNDRTALFSFLSGSPVRIGFQSGRFLKDRVAYTHTLASGLGKIHTVDHHLKIAEFLDLPTPDRHPFLPVLPDRRHNVEATLAREGLSPGEPFVIIHPGARRPYKSWPRPCFARLADAIRTRFDAKVVLSGSREDMPIAGSIEKAMETAPVNLAGKVDLADLPALIQKGLCLIGNDSAPIHIATAVKTPTISLFGPTRWEDWAPRRDSDRVLAAEYPCRPCGHSKKECPLKDEYCMHSIPYEEVWSTLENLFNSGNQ